VEAFEESFASLMGQRHAVACPYGRTALALVLEAMEIKGKEVICPAYTCVVVPHAIVMSGNEPVFVDSQDTDFNMDLDRVNEVITENTAAIIPTSIFGYPVDLDKLDALRREHPHLCVIQDCAHSFAAQHGTRYVQRDGDAAIFGLNISKMMTSIFGGMITTDDSDLYKRIVTVREERLTTPSWRKGFMCRLYFAASLLAFMPPFYTVVNALERHRLLNRFVKYYEDDIIDMPKDYLTRMTPIQGAIGRIQTERYQEIIARRRENAAFYSEVLKEIPELRLPPLIDGATYSHYVPRLAGRDDLLRYAVRRGAQLGKLIDYCVPDMDAYTNRPGSRMTCSVAQQMVSVCVNLPLTVGQKDRNKVARVVQDFMHTREQS
jgi:dTDP-4-amino-4,6-dideoxygalactose transaminase